MERLRDCIKEMVKFTLTHRSGFDLELTGDFCSGLLSGDSLLHAGDGIEPLFQNPFVLCSCFIESVCVFVDAETVEAFAGVPEYPKGSNMITQKGSELVNVSLIKSHQCLLEFLFDFDCSICNNLSRP